MTGASVNFQKISSAVHAVGHASREVPPLYLLPENLSLGTIVVIDDAGDVQKLLDHKMSLASRQAKASKNYSPMWEGVINLRRPLKDEDSAGYKKECAGVIKEWCVEYEKMTGHKVIRADVHLDEGHIEDGAVLLNAHAHVMCDKTDDRGRVIKMTPQTLREIQTMTAEVTKLERGVNSRISGKKHISAHQYKYLAERGSLENQKNLDVEKSNTGRERSLTDSLLQRQRAHQLKLKEVQAVADKVPDLAAEIARLTKILEEQYRLARQAMKDSGTAKQADYQALKKAFDEQSLALTANDEVLTKAQAQVTAKDAELATANIQADKVPGLEADARQAAQELITANGKLTESKAALDGVTKALATAQAEADQVPQLEAQAIQQKEKYKALHGQAVAIQTERNSALASLAKAEEKVETMTQQNTTLQAQLDAKTEADRVRFAAMGAGYQADVAAGVPAHLIMPSPAPLPPSIQKTRAAVTPVAPKASERAVEAPKPQTLADVPEVPEKTFLERFKEAVEAAVAWIKAQGHEFEKLDTSRNVEWRGQVLYANEYIAVQKHARGACQIHDQRDLSEPLEALPGIGRTVNYKNGRGTVAPIGPAVSKGGIGD
jgi:hypothetical protein